MKRLALAAAISAAMVAPAFAQDSTGIAIMHFNMDEDSQSDVRMVPAGDIVTVDLDETATLSDIFSRLNMDEDSVADMRGGNGVTIVMTDPSRAADIFAMLMEASREDE